jgi:cation transport regulator ChaC
MKNLFFLLALSMLFTMCTNQKQQMEKAQMRTDSLQRLVLQKDSAIYGIMGTFSEIENNLATIKEKEKMISLTVKDVENPQSREEKINDDINSIYDLMLKNKEKVAKLESLLKKAKIKNSALEKTIESLEAQLAEKNTEIINLRQQLLNMNLKIDELTYSMDTLKFENEVKKEIIKAQDESLNTAYYLFGTEKELKEKKILDSKGGFIGIGGGKTLNKDFDKALFTPIDIRNKTSFDLKSKKIRIITTHPTSSYQLYGEKPVDSLVVKNPADFWSVSKYFVVVLY